MLREIKSGIYHLLHPKVTFFLTSIDKNGKPNVMTCAWATPAGDEPPIVIVCVSKEHHTAKLIRQTKEFAINIPTKKLLPAIWICGKSSGRDTDKFQKTKLEIIKAKKIRTPLIKNCIGYIECRLWKTVDAGECYAFFGEVLSASVDDRYYKKGQWIEKSEIPLHLAGSRMVYFR